MTRSILSTGLLLATAFLPMCAQSPSATPAQTNDPGAINFSTNCSGCHGSDGRGGERAPNIATARNIVSLSDVDLVSIVNKGVPGTGMPSFGFLGEQGVKDVVAHLRSLQGKTSTMKASGDAAEGRTLFFGWAECSQCHMVKGEGGYIGADLSDYASGLSLEEILRAITDPDASLSSNSTVVELRLPDGRHIDGIARAEDNFDITLQMKDGRWLTFNKAKLVDITHTGHSFHPRDYGTRLSAKELDDLISYLVVSAANVPARHQRRRGH